MGGEYGMHENEQRKAQTPKPSVLELGARI